jgi:hypothetical protein
MAAESAPSARCCHAAVWTGEEMLIWGGDDGWPLGGVARYDPQADAWTPLPPGGDVAGGGAIVKGMWTGTEFIVMGGFLTGPERRFVLGARWNPISDAWTPLSSNGAPERSLRFAAPSLAVWTGNRVIAWYSEGMVSGRQWSAAYDPARDTWEPLSVEGAPAPRYNSAAVWTGREMVILGGGVSDRSAVRGIRILDDAGAYAPATGTWRRFRGPARYYLTAVWTDSEIIVFGGAGGSGGGRYLPPCSLP